VRAADSLATTLLAAADRHPDRVAVVEGDRPVTYAALAAAAHRVAATLGEQGVSPGDHVGVWFPKSIDAVTALYGVLLAGAAYIPLDPKAPVARGARIATDAGTRVLITSGSKARDWAPMVEAAPGVEQLLVLDRTAADAPDAPRPARWADQLADAGDLVPPAADDVAYVLYTSGSTGQPKGVVLSHRNALAFVDWAVAAVGVHAEDRLSSHAPFHFDLSVFDLYAAARAGASVHLVPQRAMVFPVELARWIDAAGVTTWYSVPSALALLVTSGDLEAPALPQLRTVIFAGEVFPSPLLTQLMALVPSASYWNWYGPTETNVCTAHHVAAAPGEDAPPIPIGRAIDGVTTLVVDESGAPVEPGTEGELVVTGPTVTSGYWADAERTATRLGPLPSLAATGDDRAWYRTGDLVVDDGHGCYEFRGRRDHQVKSRGYRIELGEVEAAFHRHPAVVDAAIVAVPDPVVTNRLHAFVTVDAASDPTPSELSKHVAALVPPYMVPEQVEVLATMPRTSTGKVDRQALQERADTT
jgi:amino acid adenylation domain-containing protein